MMRDNGVNVKEKMVSSKTIMSYIMLALCIIVISSFVLLPLSSAEASAWTPEDELRSYLLDNYPWEEIEVSHVQVLGKITDERPERILVEKGPLGRAVFSFVFSNNDQVMVRADVRAFGQVILSKRPFKRRHVIEDEDVYLSKMDIGKMPRNLLNDPERILGKSLKRSINANMPIKEDMIEMYQIVERGKRVILLLSHNGMIMRTAGKTKEKGYVGMPVRAMNLSSKKEVSGVLIDENTVKVEL
jgi:flagella basal body P-ring formation protein FlgA